VADLTTTIDTHLAAYCEPDAERRATLVAEVWNPEGELIDPPMEGQGLDAIAGLGGAVVTHYPGHTFRRTTTVDEHHGYARYGWAMVAPDGTRLWLSGRYDSEVYVFDTATGALVGRIATDPSPHGLAVWPQPGRYSLGHTGNTR